MKTALVVSFLLSSLLVANDGSKYDEMFLDSLNEVSAIATKTKLNVDDMPAFVTILHREKMESLGISSVYEALGLVPGVELSMESSGAKEIIFRGVKEKGKVKLMVDGITINNAYRASIYYFLDFPIELIDKIEVVRGPGSVVHGSNAISGVINIITTNTSDISGSRLFATAATYDEYKAGGHVSHNFEDLHVSADVYYQKSDKHLDAGPDKVGQVGTTDERLKDYSLGLHIESNHFGLNARFKKSNAGLAYGLGSMLIPEDENEYHKNRTIFSELSYKNSFDNKNNYTLKVGFNQYKQQISTQFVPTNPPLLYSSDYEEQGFNGSFEYVSNTFSNQEIALGVEFDHVESEKQGLNIQNHPTLQTETLIKPGRIRNISSLYINDQVDYSEYLNLSLGIRYDHYSDFGDAFSPRLALVSRISETTTFKAMYSRAFRAPSWIELYANVPAVSVGDEDLEPETSDTFEVGLIHKVNNQSVIRFNVYATRIHNIIYQTEEKQYTQDGYNDFIGSEIEWHYKPLSELEVNLNLGYVEARDDNNTALADISGFLGNASFIYDFDFALRSATLYKFVTQREREVGDTREALDGYHLLDQTFTYTIDEVTFLVAVKNIFDAQVLYPSDAGSYESDFIREGRVYMGRVSWSF